MLLVLFVTFWLDVIGLPEEQTVDLSLEIKKGPYYFCFQSKKWKEKLNIINNVILRLDK